MGELHKALGDISSIRRQMAHSTHFRGYGPATLAATGVIALLAASWQSMWLPDPANHISAYLGIWIFTAVLSAALTGVQMYTRTRRMHSGLSNEMIRMAVEQFLPAVGAGVLITIALVRFVPAVLWMLAGDFYPWHLFVLSISAAPYDCCCGMVSAQRAGLYRTWR
jgi:hypothetical protein